MSSEHWSASAKNSEDFYVEDAIWHPEGCAWRDECCKPDAGGGSGNHLDAR